MKIKALISITLLVAIVEGWKDKHDYKKDYHHYEPIPVDTNPSPPFPADTNPSPPFPGGGTCSAIDIRQGNVQNCNCVGGSGACTPLCTRQQYGLKVCNTVCDATNYPCQACDIYYSDVCECEQALIQGKMGQCITRTPWAGVGAPPTWIYRKFNSNLITSPVLNTGVEHLQDMPDKDDGWILGLSQLTPVTEALAMNSKNSRSRNQIHIHLCNKNQNAEGALAGLDNYKTFTRVSNNLVCEVVTGVPKVSTNVVAYLRTQSADYVDRAGIGLLYDRHGRLWNCISEGGAAEYIFCH